MSLFVFLTRHLVPHGESVVFERKVERAWRAVGFCKNQSGVHMEAT